MALSRRQQPGEQNTPADFYQLNREIHSNKMIVFPSKRKPAKHGYIIQGFGKYPHPQGVVS